MFDRFRGKAADNDSALFERLVARHQDKLYRVAYRMTGNADDAQDLVQDVVIEAFKAFASFRQGTYFDRWLYRIMTRTFIDKQRSKKRSPVVSLDTTGNSDENGEFSTYDIADSINDPGRIIEREQFAEPVQIALSKLSPDFRLLLILADVEEMSYEECAEILKCPVGTVRSRLHRARSQVRTQLETMGFTK